jgi:hypothetical protein
MIMTTTETIAAQPPGVTAATAAAAGPRPGGGSIPSLTAARVSGDPAAAVWPGTADLRAVSQQVADAIHQRVQTENRAGHAANNIDADLAKVMVASARQHEDDMRRLLTDVYLVHVPESVRAWIATVPGLASGELFPRICGITGNPRVAIPMRWTGESPVPVPDGPPRWRSPRQLLQWAGGGNPYLLPYSDLLGHPVTREDKMAAGKRTQLRPLLHTWTGLLLRSASPVTKEGSAKFGQPVSQAAAGSKYWQVFCAAREAAQSKVHERTCKNRKLAPFSNGCGTVAHPEWGEPGSPWRPQHVLRHAHRLAQKEFMIDFWLVAGGEEPRPYPRPDGWEPGA